jgi:mRNA-degrading endonuclease RelE of RelBE toxin-antitoxin system
VSWRVDLGSQPAKFVARNGRQNPDFNPSLDELLHELERDPKQFKKLKGQLAHLRSARFRWKTVPWRVVFAVNEKDGVVDVVAIDKRGDVYD